MDKGSIAKNFSRCASSYDRYADVQRMTAQELLNKMEADGFKKILEIGCGTGNYTLLLKDKFKKASLKAIDISERMVKFARDKLKERVEFMVADAEEAELAGTFDLITSNGCFQWFADLEKALARYKKLMPKNGIISFSTFGPLTFQELNTALNSLLKEASSASTRFIGIEEIRGVLERNFQEARLEEHIYEERFACLKDLLLKIKYTGVRGDGLKDRVFFGRNLLDKLEQTYLDNFQNIKATYQVFYCQARNA